MTDVLAQSAHDIDSSARVASQKPKQCEPGILCNCDPSA